MAKTNTLPTIAEVQQRFQQVTQNRAQLEQARADVEQRLADAMTAGKDTSELEREHASITARLAALVVMDSNLSDMQAQAEIAETLALYERYTAEMHAAYTEIAKIDRQIAEYQAQIKALVEARSTLKASLQVPSGRRLKLTEAVRKYNLSKATAEITKRFRVAGYM